MIHPLFAVMLSCFLFSCQNKTYTDEPVVSNTAMEQNVDNEKKYINHLLKALHDKQVLANDNFSIWFIPAMLYIDTGYLRMDRSPENQTEALEKAPPILGWLLRDSSFFSTNTPWEIQSIKNTEDTYTATINNSIQTAQIVFRYYDSKYEWLVDKSTYEGKPLLSALGLNAYVRGKSVRAKEKGDRIYIFTDEQLEQFQKKYKLKDYQRDDISQHLTPVD